MMTSDTPAIRPSLVQIDSSDNVGIAPVSLHIGEQIDLGTESFLLLEEIRFGHKVALRDIPCGSDIIKYGVPIGVASEEIRRGAHVGVHNVLSQRFGAAVPSRHSADFPRAAVVGQKVSHSDERTRFPLLGFRRADGRMGIRSHLLVLSTVSCANCVVERIAKEIENVVPITHTCGCPQVGEDLNQTLRILEGHARHPNVGAVLLVGLGCESVPTHQLTATLQSEGFLAEDVVIQEQGGIVAATRAGMRLAASLYDRMKDQQPEPMSLSDLIIGTECGGSDAWSGITANPSIGAICDRVVASGGTALLSEVSEFIGAEHLLAERAISQDVADRVLEVVGRREADATQYCVDLRGGQPTPGNIMGGLTTIEEKSMGAIAKGGLSPVCEVVAYGSSPSRSGLIIMDSPGSDIHSVTGMVASGAQLILFSTGRGTPTGSPIAPVIKIASNAALFASLADDLDFDASSVLTSGSLEESSNRLFDLFIAVCRGRLTASERHGAHDFAIETLGLRL